VLPRRPAEDDVHVPAAAAEHDVRVRRDRDRQQRQPFCAEQLGHPHPTRISVTWTASTDDWSQVYHSLLVNGVEQNAGMIGVRGSTILYLTPQTTYTFEVTARDASGNTTRSNVLSVTTPAATDTIAPTAPTNFRFSSETSPPEAWLDWDASTDNADPQSEIQYEVFVKAPASATTRTSSTAWPPA
jgi:hypothetical protein